ncbi:MAG: vWA domain-containing protein [Thermodesulfobacteriota bacterium]
MMFRFASPLFFVLLMAVPLAVWYRRRIKPHPSLKVSDTVEIQPIGETFLLAAGRMLPALKYLAFALMVIAMARPQWGTRQTSILTEGVNLILAVDVSESMAALDFKKEGKIVNRLEAVKGVVQDFITKRRGDRIGMVVFGTNAYTQLPLTRDYNTIAFILDRLRIGAAGPNTAIGDAIGISLKRLADIKSKSNVLILLTDGQSNAGQLTPEDAAAAAVQQGVKIYTIGVGTRGRAPFLIRDPLFGERYVYQQVDMDEGVLKKIAGQTGGLYFRAEDLKGLKTIYETIDRLEKTDVRMKSFEEYRELYTYFLLPALGLLAAWILLSNTRFLRIP